MADMIKGDMKADTKYDASGKPVNGDKPSTAADKFRVTEVTYKVGYGADGKPIPSTERVMVSMAPKG